MSTLTCDVAALKRALQMVSSVPPARTPKPILQNVLLEAGPGREATLAATDLELGVTARVIGVESPEDVALVLPPDRLKRILDGAQGEKVTLTVEDGENRSVTITGQRQDFSLPLEDDSLFTRPPRFDAEAYHSVSAEGLKRAIRRTIFTADDTVPQQYATGGCLLDVHEGKAWLVGLGSARLTVAGCDTEGVGVEGVPKNVILPKKSLKVLASLVSPDDPPVHVGVLMDEENNIPRAVVVRTDMAELYTRLVEGRFPNYRSGLPKGEASTTVCAPAGKLAWGFGQAAITTSETSHAVVLTVDGGKVAMKTAASEKGRAGVEVETIGVEGEDVEVTFDHRYVTEFLRAIDPLAMVRVEFRGPNSNVMFTEGDHTVFLAVPMDPVTVAKRRTEKVTA